MGLKKRLLDFIYPEALKCQVCGSDLNYYEVPGICQHCLSKIEFVKFYCQLCGRKISNFQPVLDPLCADCQEMTPPFDIARGGTVYQGFLRRLLLELKYGGQKKLIKPLAALLCQYYFYFYKNKQIDLIIPIPLHNNRYRERGYNQAELLALPLQRKLAKPILRNCLLRWRDTPPLFDIGVKKRRSLIKGAFTLTDTNKCRGKNVLLIDDIFTTGTTAAEASRLLKIEGGAEKVYVMTLATADIDKP